MFESRDWTEGNIDEYVLGAIYEKLISKLERKKSGTYYTPEAVTSYINKSTIKPYIIEIINEEFNANFKTFEEIIEEDKSEYFFKIFKILKNIKILDPAIGSAHFLESSINVLIEIYLIIWSRLLSLGLKRGLEIITLNESGEIEKLDILKINDSEKLILYLKFFIILTRNIYGVDINPSALKIARARLFLSLAKHFDVKKNYFIQFPNVHFNLRQGNSLIGYVNLIREENKQKEILDFSGEEIEKNKLTKKISIISNLKDFIKKTAKLLGIKMDVIQGIESLNIIFNKKKILWNDFVKFLKIKKNLIKILIASLNSKYAKPLNELLNQMTHFLNEKLDLKFANDYNLKINNLKKVKTFHWIFEFPEVFLNRKGFDIIIGNPPFVRADTEDDIFIKQREILTNLSVYETLWEKWDLFVAFVERSIKYLLKENGKFSFIISDAICTVKYAEKIRNWIQKAKYIRRIDYFEGFEVFKGIGVNPIILFVDNKPSVFKTYKRIHTNNFSNITSDIKVKQNSKYVWKKGDTEILDYDIGDYELLKNICYISVGMVPNAHEKKAKGEFVKDDLISDNYSEIHNKMYLEGKYTSRFKIKEVKYIEWGTDRSPAKLRRPTFPELYIGKKIIRGSQTEGVIDDLNIFTNHSLNIFRKFIDLKGVNNKSITMSLGRHNSDKDRESLENISKKYSYEYILAVLNSKYGNVYLNAIRRHKLPNTFYPDDFRQLPIKKLKDQKVFVYLVHYLQFLYQTDGCNEIIKFFDKKLLNFLIYELYFKEKLIELGIYQDLIKYIQERIECINYEEWVNFLFKELNRNELAKKKKIEKENLNIIKRVYNKLNTEEFFKKIREMEKFEWIQKIEKY